LIGYNGKRFGYFRIPFFIIRMLRQPIGHLGLACEKMAICSLKMQDSIYIRKG